MSGPDPSLRFVTAAHGDEEGRQQPIATVSARPLLQFIEEEPGHKHREKAKRAVRSHAARSYHRQQRLSQWRSFQLNNQALETEEELAAGPSEEDVTSTGDNQYHVSIQPALLYKNNSEFPFIPSPALVIVATP
jgi:hypothetical protein